MEYCSDTMKVIPYDIYKAHYSIIILHITSVVKRDAVAQLMQLLVADWTTERSEFESR
jgi:hypothetical protein